MFLLKRKKKSIWFSSNPFNCRSPWQPLSWEAPSLIV